MLRIAFRHSTFTLCPSQIVFHINGISFSKMRYKELHLDILLSMRQTWGNTRKMVKNKVTMIVLYIVDPRTFQRKIHVRVYVYTCIRVYIYILRFSKIRISCTMTYVLWRNVNVKITHYSVLTIEQNKYIYIFFIPSVYTHSIAFSNFFLFFFITQLATWDLLPLFHTNISLSKESR